MPVKIRLARHGRKRIPYYHIVVADSRTPRDGKNIERIGTFNPSNQPATVELDFDKALYWVQKGAQPSDTCRSILSENGVLMKKHLLEGVRKGAFDESEAERRFESWMKDKELKKKAENDKLSEAKSSAEKERLEAEKKVREAKEAVIKERLEKELAAKKEAEEKAKAEAEAEAAETEESSEGEKAEEPEAKTEEPKAEETEAKKEEEPKAEEKDASDEEKKDEK
ncbi:MAG TPA: 30S ribosomal protein S16 [Bacteroidales bacterium]|nr:30S ribosomal protein S16 [Bacteroidales bacterium]